MSASMREITLQRLHPLVTAMLIAGPENCRLPAMYNGFSPLDTDLAVELAAQIPQSLAFDALGLRKRMRELL